MINYAPVIRGPGASTRGLPTVREIPVSVLPHVASCSCFIKCTWVPQLASCDHCFRMAAHSRPVFRPTAVLSFNFCLRVVASSLHGHGILGPNLQKRGHS